MSGTPHVSEPGPKDKYYFLLRRLHSLTGIVPVGAFVIVHLTVNSRIFSSGAAFNEAVKGIHLLGTVGILVPVEILFIFLPLAFHAGLGVLIALTASHNAGVYRYGGNVRYSLQRATAWIALAFILFHIWQMHWLGAFIPGGAQFEPHSDRITAAGSAAEIMQQTWWWPALYSVGVLATVFHLANGLWTSLITWGITVGERAQRMSGYACAALGLALSCAGVGSAVKFYKYDVSAETGVSAPAHTASVEASTGDSGSGPGAANNDLITGEGANG